MRLFLQRLFPFALVACVSLAIYSCSSTTAPTPALPSRGTYVLDTIFPNHGCGQSSCHSSDRPSANLALDKHQAAYDSLVSGLTEQTDANDNVNYPHRIVKGNPDASYLIVKLTRNPTTQQIGINDKMPKGLPALSQAEIDAIKQWIKNGAPND